MLLWPGQSCSLPSATDAGVRCVSCARVGTGLGALLFCPGIQQRQREGRAGVAQFFGCFDFVRCMSVAQCLLAASKVLATP